VAKTLPVDRRTAALADDEEFDDFYRPESPIAPRARRRVSGNTRGPASSTGDFADPLARTRSRRARADMLSDGYDGQHDDSYDAEADDDFEAPSPRARRRVPVARNARRLGLLSTKFGRIGLALGLVAIFGVLGSVFLLVRGFFLHDPRFRVDNASSIQILGNSEISHAELIGVFAPDLQSGSGRNIFMVPLAQRRADLQQLPWVQSATVMRLLPNQLRVSIVERVPVAFVREGNKIELVDADGVILSMPSAMLAARHYSFPVVIGIDPNDPPETRADRMQVYEKFVTALDGSTATGAATPATTTGVARPTTHATTKPSQQLSEVDVSDPEDVRALLPSAGSDILVHFGDDDFANRYHLYQQHLPQWRLQYPHLAAVDLRYDRQTVLEMAKSSSQDPTNADKVDTTPTLAAATPGKPAAATVAMTHAPAKNPAPVVKPPAKPQAKSAAKPAKQAPPAYVLPYDNPHTKHG
jgi:cell division protein FtsQ